MSQPSKQHFIQQLPQLQFDRDPQHCWQHIQQGLTSICQESFTENNAIPFDLWWQQSFELLSARQVYISHIQFDGNLQDEYLELSNRGPAIINLKNWRINAGNDGQDFSFAESSLLHPGKTIRIYTSGEHQYSFNSQRPIWNNKGDCGLLYDASGTLVCSRVYGNKVYSEVAIENIEFDGQQKHTEGDEFIEIANRGSHWVDISGWTVSAGEKQDFHFPQGASIAPFTSTRVYTNLVDPQTGGFSFNSPRAIWNNKGDRGRLLDQNGVEVSEYSYGSL